MIQVIETNLSIDNKGQIADHQSRVIEVDNWDDFIDEIKQSKTVIRNSYLGVLNGTTIPRCAKVENLTHDDKHLMCDVYNYLGVMSKKLVYKI